MATPTETRKKPKAEPSKIVGDHAGDDVGAFALVRYDAMCNAITACHKVDEVKHIHDKAIALKVYARQARNFKAEQKAYEIRMRAEKRAGQLLKEMKGAGQRANEKGSNKKVSSEA